MNRRAALNQMVVAAAGLSMARAVSAAQPAPAPDGAKPPAPGGPPAGQHAVKPLPFSPKKLRGLSERMIVSHHDNNYAGAVKNLNHVEEGLAGFGVDTPGFVLASLKEKELTFTNSVLLHELYFENLGGDGRPGGGIEKELRAAHATYARWEEGFRAVGMSLAGGSGWAILDLNLRSGELGTYWAGNHSQSIAQGCPLLVMDMYEHAYALDYGAEAARYVDAFFRNVDWAVVDRRFERARAAAAALAV
jgi:Fe-Mn family superoxide dismutase